MVSAFISVHLFDEDLDLAAAGEAHVPGLLVSDAEIQEPRLAVGDGGQRLLHDGALDAAAGHRTDHGAGVVDAELAADRARRGPPGGDHGRNGHALAGGFPLTDLVENIKRVAHGLLLSLFLSLVPSSLAPLPR